MALAAHGVEHANGVITSAQGAELALILIPARGGSKGIPGKNLTQVGGLSLVARAVRRAQCFVAAHPGNWTIVVDTDDAAIASEARRWGAEVPFLRAPELARDDTSTAASVIGTLDRFDAMGIAFRDVVLIQPTSPLADAEDVAGCWQAYHPETSPSIAAVTEEPHASALVGLENGVMRWLAAEGGGARRQDAPPVARLTGAAYVVSAQWLRRERRFVVAGVTRPVMMPAARSVDVDTPADLAAARGMAWRESRPVTIGRRTIGGGAPCYIIAEAGVNHNGDVALAHRLVDAAANAGADAVKFQTFDPDLVVSVDAAKAEYQRERTGGGGQLEMLRALCLPHADFAALAAHAAKRGIDFMSTAFDLPSLDFVDSLGVPALKVPSGEVTNTDLLGAVARRGRTVLVSTGMCDMADVAAALEVLRANGDPHVALFHCVSSYPATPADANLRAMDAMREAYGVPVGWSDHTEGLAVSLAAAALGAEVIEKHFTLDRSMKGPDHAASLEPDELAALVTGIRAAQAARGDGVKRPTAAEFDVARAARRSLHVARDLAAGETIDASALVALRPGSGLPPAARDGLLGRRTARAIRAGQMLAETDLA